MGRRTWGVENLQCILFEHNEPLTWLTRHATSLNIAIFFGFGTIRILELVRVLFIDSDTFTYFNVKHIICKGIIQHLLFGLKVKFVVYLFLLCLEILVMYFKIQNQMNKLLIYK